MDPLIPKPQLLESSIDPDPETATVQAYDGSRLRVHGHSIEDADLQSFWQMYAPCLWGHGPV